jgi:pyruvate/2-oxoglutarate dehydrogenase complex dihydrolipoamide dehydrogenase (E3) component
MPAASTSRRSLFGVRSAATSNTSASVFGSLGTKVMIVVRGPHLLSQHDADVRAHFTAAYAERFDLRPSSGRDSETRTSGKHELVGPEFILADTQKLGGYEARFAEEHVCCLPACGPRPAYEAGRCDRRPSRGSSASRFLSRLRMTRS